MVDINAFQFHIDFHSCVLHLLMVAPNGLQSIFPAWVGAGWPGIAKYNALYMHDQKCLILHLEHMEPQAYSMDCK